MEIKASEEMYLETILRIKEKTEFIRSIDIAEQRGFAKSSVSRAMKLLQQKGYITIQPNGQIDFTEEGLRRASSVYDRHCVLTELLVYMGAPRGMAEENACRMEHVISEELFVILKARAEELRRAEESRAETEAPDASFF